MLFEKSRLKQTLYILVLICSLSLLKQDTYATTLYLNISLFFTQVATIFYGPISFYLGNILSSSVSIPELGHVVLMGLPYFVICLILQYVVTYLTCRKYLHYFYSFSLFFSQIEMLLIIKKRISELQNKDLRLVLVLGFCTMSSGVTVYYQYSYFLDNTYALNMLVYGQIISYTLCLLLLPIYSKYTSEDNVLNLFPMNEGKDFLGLKGLFETLMGALVGVVFTVGVLNLLTFVANNVFTVRELCLASSCESSVFFTLIVRVQEGIAILLGFGEESFKMAYIVSQSLFYNEKVAFLIMSQVDFINKKNPLILVSLISNFINIYALGFCIGVLSFWVKKVDKNIFSLCIKTFLYAVLIKVLTVALLSLRLLV